MDRDRLETLRDGVMPPREALVDGRVLIASEEGRDALEDGSRDWLISAARGENTEPDAFLELQETFRRFASLSRSLSPAPEVEAHAAFAIRMENCADIAADLAAFESHYAGDALRGLPHFEPCLTLLYHAHDQSLPRGELLRQLDLKEANGTRVLKALEKAGFVTRRQEGRTKRVKLTSRGRTTVCRWISPPRREEVEETHVLLITPIAGMRTTFPARRVSA